MTNQLQMIKLPELAQRLCLGKSTIQAMAARGDFPKPTKLNTRSAAWPVSQVEAWLEQRTKLTNQK
jgi:predicted DNA-binding transcriptional regulator AlpA